MSRFFSFLLRLEAIIAALLLILMVLLIFLGGVARMMQMPLNWTIDLATCFFAWACFLCADIAWRSDAMMSVDLAVNRLPEQIRRLIGYINHLLICAFLVYLIYSGLILAYVSRARSFQGIPEISYSWVTLSLPVGSALLLLTTIGKLRAAIEADGLRRRPM
jgi:TRAP-type C4-dicarboxylate transport system permease small subunit